MHILAHRGLWLKDEEKNSLSALSAAFQIGVGVETDLRDCNGLLVVSHDPPHLSESLPFEVLLKAYLEYSPGAVLALNIKADGLQAMLLTVLQRFGVENYFVFDMSVPDTLGYQRMQMPFAARVSEYESGEEIAKEAEWIWLDAFHDEWFGAEIITAWLNKGKRVAIVSSELHRRPHLSLWEILKPLSSHSHLYLCTDLVGEAKEFFDA